MPESQALIWLVIFQEWVVYGAILTRLLISYPYSNVQATLLNHTSQEWIIISIIKMMITILMMTIPMLTIPLSVMIPTSIITIAMNQTLSVMIPMII